MQIKRGDGDFDQKKCGSDGNPIGAANPDLSIDQGQTP